MKWSFSFRKFKKTKNHYPLRTTLLVFVCSSTFFQNKRWHYLFSTTNSTKHRQWILMSLIYGNQLTVYFHWTINEVCDISRTKPKGRTQVKFSSSLLQGNNGSQSWLNEIRRLFYFIVSAVYVWTCSVKRNLVSNGENTTEYVPHVSPRNYSV